MSVTAISPLDITLQQIGKTHRFHLKNWSRDFINGESIAEFQDSMVLQTAFVFKIENATVKANMKGTKSSNVKGI